MFKAIWLQGFRKPELRARGAQGSGLLSTYSDLAELGPFNPKGSLSLISVDPNTVCVAIFTNTMSKSESPTSCGTAL